MNSVQQKIIPFSDTCATLFLRSISLFSVSTCFILFEVTCLYFFSLSSKSLFSTKSSIPSLVANFVSSNLAGEFSAVN